MTRSDGGPVRGRAARTPLGPGRELTARLSEPIHATAPGTSSRTARTVAAAAEDADDCAALLAALGLTAAQGVDRRDDAPEPR